MVFVKNGDGSWIMMKVDDLTSRMIYSSADIDQTLKESHQGFKKPVKKVSD